MAEKRTAEVDGPQSKRRRLDNGNESELLQAEQERAVGITAWVSPDQPGFNCVVKQRYTDFLVNEIQLSGQVLHLNSLPGRKSATGDNRAIENTPANPKTPKPTADIIQKPEEPQHLKQEQPDAIEGTPKEEYIEPEVSPRDVTILQHLFGEIVTAQIISLYAAVLNYPHRKPRDQPQVQSEVMPEKSQRTQAHVAVRRIFQAKLESSTMQDQLPGAIAIKAAPSKGASGARGDLNGSTQNGAIAKGKLGWSDLGGEYLHFTLYKENKDTMEALSFIASQLKIPAKNFEFAGTKDRRGVTVQRVAVFRIHAARITSLNKMAKGWVASDFSYHEHGLSLGDLLGNEFLLTLRDCHVAGEEGLSPKDRFEKVKKDVDAAAESFRVNGFINYYGLQRFGTFSTGTHVIGMKMLQGDLEGAINSILSYQPSLLTVSTDGEHSKIPRDDIDRAEAIKNWRETGNVSFTLPRRFQAESAMMRYLGKKDKKTGQLVQATDWQGALMQIQRNLRLMYVHAYQSLVWNTVAAKRWNLYGAKVVEGDLVIIGDKDDIGKAVRDEVDEIGQPVFHPAADDTAATADGDYKRARPLSKDEAESGRYNIFDIVLPLPGYDVIYPKNELDQVYVDFMASETGGGLDPYKMRRAFRDISLSGGYRKVMARPGRGFEVQVHEYSNELEQLVETDLERLKKATAGEGEEVVVVGGALDEAQTQQSEEKKIAVVLKFQLGSSQYATMALRELTKGGSVGFVPDFSSSSR